MPNTYETFAKLNIMSPLADTYEKSQPQLMFTYVNNNANKSWKGQMMAFNYTAGSWDDSCPPLFRVHEKTTKTKSKMNFDLLGNNNLYRSGKGTNGAIERNSFIFSQDNEVQNFVHDTTFINSDDNVIETHLHDIDVINSNGNTFMGGWDIHGNTPLTHDVNLFCTDNSRFQPAYHYVKGLVTQPNGTKKEVWNYSGGDLQGQTLIDSDQSVVYGFTNKKYHGVAISSPRNRHTLSDAASYEVQIGNEFGYTQYVSGGLIAIGRGLTYIKGQGDKIILGNFNENDINDNAVLIVGDGYVTDNYLKKIEPLLKKNDNSFWRALSGRGDRTNYYRHNLMQVNRKGYIGIYNFDNPQTQWAQYGYDGITARDGNNLYKIKYQDIYSKLNAYDTMSEYQSIIDSYTKKVKEFTNSVPKAVFGVISSGQSVDLNSEIKNRSSDLYKSLVGGTVTQNTILTISVQNPDAGPEYSVNITSHIKRGEQSVRSETVTVKNYNSVQYLCLNTTDSGDTMNGFSKINN